MPIGGSASGSTALLAGRPSRPDVASPRSTGESHSLPSVLAYLYDLARLVFLHIEVADIVAIAVAVLAYLIAMLSAVYM